MANRTAPQYDFYATAPTPAPGALPAPSSVAPASGAAVNQFGTPLGFGATTPMAEPVSPAATRMPRSRGVRLPAWAWRWIATLAVALVLGVFGVGRFAGIGGLFAGDLELPATLAGMAQDTTSDQAVMMSEILDDISGSSEGAVAALYSNAYVSTMVVATPDEASAADVQQVFSHPVFSPTQRLGQTTCAALTNAPASMCMRSGDGRTVAVAHASTDFIDFTETLALLDEVWGTL